MLGELTDKQIEDMLNSCFTGRIGCYADNEMYIVPVAFVYEKPYIYVHSKEGRKIDMMRKNNKVCFQLDIIENLGNWRSAIIWGTYEELQEPDDIKKAVELITSKMAPVASSETLSPKPMEMDSKIVEKEKRPIAYRIKIERYSGRFEKF